MKNAKQSMKRIHNDSLVRKSLVELFKKDLDEIGNNSGEPTPNITASLMDAVFELTKKKED